MLLNRLVSNCLLIRIFSVMRASEFYKIIVDEISTVSFLLLHNLLPNNSETPNCKKCDSEINIVIRKKRLVSGEQREYKILICVKKGCQTFQSLRPDSKFFTFTDLNNKCNSKLSLEQILELVFYWSEDMSIVNVCRLTERSNKTVVNWYNFCHDVCCSIYENQKPMGGPNECVQIDESLLRRKRKYNRGRILLGNHRGTNLTDDDSSNSDSDSVNIPLDYSNINCSKRVDGPWVFGMCWRLMVFLKNVFLLLNVEIGLYLFQ
jgi:hypothetical protein